MSPPSREEDALRSYQRGAFWYHGLCSKMNRPNSVSRFRVTVCIVDGYAGADGGEGVPGEVEVGHGVHGEGIVLLKRRDGR